jgi:hypothetical protein
MRNSQNILIGKPERNRTLDRPIRKVEDNIKENLKDAECEGVDWIQLA